MTERKVKSWPCPRNPDEFCVRDTCPSFPKVDDAVRAYSLAVKRSDMLLALGYDAQAVQVFTEATVKLADFAVKVAAHRCHPTRDLGLYQPRPPVH